MPGNRNRDEQSLEIGKVDKVAACAVEGENEVMMSEARAQLLLDSIAC